jgi:hypothetical protein
VKNKEIEGLIMDSPQEGQLQGQDPKGTGQGNSSNIRKKTSAGNEMQEIEGPIMNSHKDGRLQGQNPKGSGYGKGSYTITNKTTMSGAEEALEEQRNMLVENSSGKKSGELLKKLDNDYAAAAKGKGDEVFPKDLAEAVSRVTTYKPMMANTLSEFTFKSKP